VKRTSGLGARQEGGGAKEQVADPYASDPARHRALVVRSEKPFNAETPAAILGEQLHTPNDLFYVRHHLPVPHVRPEDYRLEVKGAPIAPVLILLSRRAPPAQKGG